MAVVEYIDSIAQSPVPSSNHNKSVYLDFYDALKVIAKGGTVARIIWESGTNCYLRDGRLRITISGSMYIWEIDVSDMLAEDWVVIND